MFRHRTAKLIGILFLLLLGFFLFYIYSEETVAFGEIKQENQTLGYSIKRSRFLLGTRVEIWNTQGLKFNFYNPEMYVRRVKNEKWLSNHRAIYLDFDTAFREDSIMPSRPTKILFDYKRGEVYVVSTANLWRSGSRFDWMEGDKDWMTEEEFQKKLEQLDK